MRLAGGGGYGVTFAVTDVKVRCSNGGFSFPGGCVGLITLWGQWGLGRAGWGGADLWVRPPCAGDGYRSVSLQKGYMTDRGINLCRSRNSFL